MDRRQPLPRLWMMTDERQGEGLTGALGRLPPGAGAVFRHYSLAEAERRRLFDRVRAMTSSRGQLLMLAAPAALAQAWGADGSHGLSGGDSSAPGLWRSASVHDVTQLARAEQARVDFVFASPVFATRSHPEGAPLGVAGLDRIARSSKVPVIALGGMNAARARELAGSGIYGWAAIDAWSEPPSG